MQKQRYVNHCRNTNRGSRRAVYRAWALTFRAISSLYTSTPQSSAESDRQTVYMLAKLDRLHQELNTADTRNADLHGTD